MNKMVTQILRPSTQRQLITSLGICLGVVLVSLSSIVHFHTSNLIEHENKKGQFLVVNKEINILNTLFFAKAGISKKEIKELTLEEQIIDAGPMQSNQFDVRATLGGQIGLITEFFMESVPDKFIDFKSSKWRWKKEGDIVPIILSRDLYNLYNFSFASSQGLPQLSIGTIDKITITLRLKGNGKEVKMKAKIIGLSDRINSILVPENYLKYTNGTFASKEKQSFSRLILQVKNPSSPELKSLLKKHKLLAKKELFNIGKGLKMVEKIIPFILFIGSTLIFFTFLVNKLTLENLLLSKNSELMVLIHLGYAPKNILIYYRKGLYIQTLLIMISTLVILYFGNAIITQELDNYGYQVHERAFLFSSLISLSLISLGFFYTFLSIKKKLYSIV